MSLEDNQALHQEIGRLIEATSILRKEVNGLSDRLKEIEGKISTGRGILIGIFLLSGLLGAQISNWLRALFS